jgi:hypothetical protein
VIALAIAVGVSACGGGGGDSADARQVVKQTFNGQKKVDSGRLDLSLTAKLQGSGAAAAGLKDPIVLKMTGPFQGRGDNQLPAMDLTLGVSGSGQDFQAGAITTGEKGYLSFQGKDYAVPANVFDQFKKGFEQQQRKDKSSSQLDLNALGVNPESWLANPKNEGTENVGGADTTHVSSDVNVDALLNDLNDLLKRADKLDLSQQQLQQLPKSLSGENRKLIKESIKQAKVDLWTGKDDKTLRRLELKLVFDLPAKLQQRSQGLQGGDVDLKLEIADVNKKQDINAPANPRPWSELQQQFGSTTLGALGGGSGSSGSGSSGSGSSGSGSSGGGTSGGTGSQRTNKYLKCVQKASTPADVNACGSILGR